MVIHPVIVVPDECESTTEPGLSKSAASVRYTLSRWVVALFPERSHAT